MLRVKSTKNNTGITISGDYNDLCELYESMGELTGTEKSYPGYECVNFNCLGFAYDIRHAFMGDREVELVDNGVNRDIEKYHSMIMPSKNLYFSVNVFWIEAMFIVLAMNDYIELAEEPKTYSKRLKNLPEEVSQAHKKKITYSIAVVKVFQAAVWQEFRNFVGDNRFNRIYKKTLNEYDFINNIHYNGFCTQYLDELTVKYINTSVNKRPTKLAACIRSIVEKSDEYLVVEREIKKFARENNIPISEVRLADVEYPEEIEW